MIDDFDLTLDDLVLDLNPKTGKATAQLPAQPKPKGVPQEEPWLAVARVLVLTRVTCTCGQTFHAPAARSLLVRFHRVNKRAAGGFDIWEQSGHPEVQNKALPLVQRFLDSGVEACAYCTEETQATAQGA